MCGMVFGISGAKQERRATERNLRLPTMALEILGEPEEPYAQARASLIARYATRETSS